MRRLAFSATLAVLAGAAAAHPHNEVDQQIALTLGLDRAEFVAVIVPPIGGGGALEHLDRDGDGAISAAEADQFAAAVLAVSALFVDGALVEWQAPQTVVAAVDDLIAGNGSIVIRADARYTLGRRVQHDISLTVAHDGLGDGWFIQPYFFDSDGIALSQPDIDRDPATGRVVIRFDGKPVPPLDG